MIQLRPKTSEELTGKERELAALTAPLLTFNLGKEIERTAPGRTLVEGWEDLRDSGEVFGFRIVLILMQAGTLMREHKADARVSIHGLCGRLMVQLPEKSVKIFAGDLLVLEKLRWREQTDSSLRRNGNENQRH